MFGGSLFGGEDENASAMGAAEDYGFSGGYDASGGQGFGGSGEYGQGMPGGSFTDNNGWRSGTIDPAETASYNASLAADHIANQEKSSVSESAMIGKSTGLFSGIHSIFNPTAVRVRRFQRVLSRNQAKFAINQAKRAKAQYLQDSQIQEQALQQSYAGRGIGESSIATEGMQYYKDTMARKIATLDENITLAQNSSRLVHSQIRDSYAQPYISFMNSVASMF